MSFESPPERELVDRLERSLCEQGDTRALDKLLSFYERILRAPPGTRDAELSEYGPIYEPLNRLFGDASLHTRLCNWLLAVAPVCRGKQRCELSVCVLEPWPQDPVSWPALEAIWLRLWNVPEARWVVLDAYNLVPLKLRPHYERFAALARSQGHELARLDDAEHREWLAEHHNWADRHELAADIDEALAKGTGRFWELLLHRPLGDPELDAVRERCARLDPTTEEGRELLRREVEQLRSAGEPPARPA